MLRLDVTIQQLAAQSPVLPEQQQSALLDPLYQHKVTLGARPSRFIDIAERSGVARQHAPGFHGGNDVSGRWIDRDDSARQLRMRPAATQQDSSLLSILASAGALLVRPPHDPPRAAGESVEWVALAPA